MVVMRRRRLLLITLAVVCLILGVGAVLSARSSDKVQGVVQVRIVNDIDTPVRFGICKDSACSSIDALETLAPGQAYDQAFGPNDRERFAVEAQSFDAHSSQVSGGPYRCTQLTTGSVVDKRYNLSTLLPCG
jgi:hypothetical protein